MKRRDFCMTPLVMTGIDALAAAGQQPAAAGDPNRLQPLGEGKGIFPGRVVWTHDPRVLDWKGPEDGHWWEGNHVKQDRADAMMREAVCRLTGESTVDQAWCKLFRHLNQARGKGAVGYQPGEKVAIKPNWVGMIWREGIVDPETYRFKKREDYMNTSPQMILALLGQLIRHAGVKPSSITVCDTLAYVVHEYYGILHQAFPDVRFEDYELQKAFAGEL